MTNPGIVEAIVQATRLRLVRSPYSHHQHLCIPLSRWLHWHCQLSGFRSYCAKVSLERPRPPPRERRAHREELCQRKGPRGAQATRFPPSSCWMLWQGSGSRRLLPTPMRRPMSGAPNGGEGNKVQSKGSGMRGRRSVLCNLAFAVPKSVGWRREKRASENT